MNYADNVPTASALRAANAASRAARALARSRDFSSRSMRALFCSATLPDDAVSRTSKLKGFDGAVTAVAAVEAVASCSVTTVLTGGLLDDDASANGAEGTPAAKESTLMQTFTFGSDCDAPKGPDDETAADAAVDFASCPEMLLAPLASLAADPRPPAVTGTSPPSASHKVLYGSGSFASKGRVGSSLWRARSATTCLRGIDESVSIRVPCNDG